MGGGCTGAETPADNQPRGERRLFANCVQCRPRRSFISSPLDALSLRSDVISSIKILSFPRFLSPSGQSVAFSIERREADAQDEEHVRTKSPLSRTLRLGDLVRTCTESNKEEEEVGLSSDFWRTAFQAHSRRLQAQDDHKSVGNERRLLKTHVVDHKLYEYREGCDGGKKGFMKMTACRSHG